jgi:hypothetical protein
MNPAQNQLAPRASILLDKQRYMYFDLNTYAAYEQETGKFFFNTVADVIDAIRGAQTTPESEGDENPQVDPMKVMRRIGMRDLRALLWASLHRYELRKGKQVAVWDLSIDEVGAMISHLNVEAIFTAFISGYAQNSPQAEDLPPQPKPNGHAPEDDARPILVDPTEFDGGNPPGLVSE